MPNLLSIQVDEYNLLAMGSLCECEIFMMVRRHGDGRK